MQMMVFVDSVRQIRAELESDIGQLKKHVLDTLHIIENKSDKTIKIYDDLEKIISLKDELITLQESLRNYTVELETFSEKIRIKSEADFENAYSSMKKKYEKDLDDLGYKIEIRLTLKLKHFESSIFTNEQKLLDINDRLMRQYKEFSKDIEAIRNMVARMKIKKSDENTAVEVNASSILDINTFQKKFQKVEDISKQAKQFIDDFYPEKYFNTDKINKELAFLEQKAIDNNNAIKTSMKKAETATIIAGLAIGAAIVSLILLFLK
jgi:hypothetical protein